MRNDVLALLWMPHVRGPLTTETLEKLFSTEILAAFGDHLVHGAAECCADWINERIRSGTAFGLPPSPRGWFVEVNPDKQAWTLDLLADEQRWPLARLYYDPEREIIAIEVLRRGGEPEAVATVQDLAATFDPLNLKVGKRAFMMLFDKRITTLYHGMLAVTLPETYIVPATYAYAIPSVRDWLGQASIDMQALCILDEEMNRDFVRKNLRVHLESLALRVKRAMKNGGDTMNAILEGVLLTGWTMAEDYSHFKDFIHERMAPWATRIQQDCPNVYNRARAVWRSRHRQPESQVGIEIC